MSFFLNLHVFNLYLYVKYSISVFTNFIINNTLYKKDTVYKPVFFNCLTPLLFFLPLDSVDSIREIFLISFLLLSFFFSLIVLTAQNPIFSALSLMATYVFSGFLLMCFGLEIYGIYFILIYAGAISVLILFVVMMINLRFKEKPQSDNKVWLILKWFIGILIILTSLSIHFSLEYLASYILCFEKGFEDMNMTLDELDLTLRDTSFNVVNLFPLLFSNEYLFVISLSLILLLIGMLGASFLVLATRKNL